MKNPDYKTMLGNKTKPDKKIRPDKEMKSGKEIKCGKETKLMQEKNKLRKEILSIRNAIPPLLRREKSDRILQKVYDMEAYKNADIILAYVDYQSEVITSPFIEKAIIDGKRVFCPKVSGDDMDFYRINGLEELKEGYKGIREPVSGEKFPDDLNSLNNKENPVSREGLILQIMNEPAMSIVIMPGVVFDRNCHRIGYGKGFYDRFMTRMSEKGLDVRAIALGYECQLLNEIPFEAHDISPDMIVTENDIYGRDDKYVQFR